MAVVSYYSGDMLPHIFFLSVFCVADTSTEVSMLTSQPNQHFPCDLNCQCGLLAA